MLFQTQLAFPRWKISEMIKNIHSILNQHTQSPQAGRER